MTKIEINGRNPTLMLVISFDFETLAWVSQRGSYSYSLMMSHTQQARGARAKSHSGHERRGKKFLGILLLHHALKGLEESLICACSCRDMHSHGAMNRKCLQSLLGLNISRNQASRTRRVTYTGQNHSRPVLAITWHVNVILPHKSCFYTWHILLDTPHTGCFSSRQSTNYQQNRISPTRKRALSCNCIHAKKCVSCQSMQALDERCLMRVVFQTGRSYPLLALSNFRVRVSSMIRLLISNKIMMI